MVIEGRDYSINVLVLFMENEVDVTVQTIETIMTGLENGVVISVLLNGGSNLHIRNLFSRCPQIRYYESDVNLGVAGGRNYLFRTEECRKADIVMVLDNDVVPPVDYIRNLASFLLKNKDAGVVGACNADIKNLSDILKDNISSDPGIFGNKVYKLTCAEVKASFFQRLAPESLYHIGMHPDYYYSYFSLRPRMFEIANIFFRRLGRKLNREHILKFNKTDLDLIRKGCDRFEVSNVAGCSQAFRRKLLDELGWLDDRFNPYGFEDVDFNIRVLKAGYKNYIDTGTWLLHGTDSRHKQRDLMKMWETALKSLTVLAANVFGDPKKYKPIIYKMIYGVFVLELLSSDRGAYLKMKAKLTGYRRGLKIIQEKQQPSGSMPGIRLFQ